jgi:hypothetical protein
MGDIIRMFLLKLLVAFSLEDPQDAITWNGE